MLETATVVLAAPWATWRWPEREGTARRIYSLSAQVQRERKQVHDQLEATHRATRAVTPRLGSADG